LSWSSGGQFVRKQSSNASIEENNNLMETESYWEQSTDAGDIEELSSDHESDWSTDSESGRGLGPIETRFEYRMKKEAA